MPRKSTCTLLMILFMLASAMTETPSQTSPSQVSPEQPATFDERLGDDDGAALAMLISANERGSLEVCD